MDNLNNQPPFQDEIKKILEDHHRGTVTDEHCSKCCSACCSHSGFAILENVLQIYELYQNGLLNREDYEFEKGLSLNSFINTYFDVYQHSTGRWPRKKDILTFHVRSIDEQGRLITIPPVGNYYMTRSGLFQENSWLNYGCVFLSKKIKNWPHDDGDCSRYCILHSDLSSTHLTAKPIDCVLYTCQTPIESKTPTADVSKAWHRALAIHYPHSPERLRAIADREGAGSEG
jgi:hypothetical protein